MSDSNLFKKFCKYVSLNVMGMLGLSCYILADTFFIARGLGTNGLTALNLAIPVFSFINGTGLMIGMGGSTKYAIQRAEGNIPASRRTFGLALILTGIFAFLFLMTGIFTDKTLTALLGADAAVYEMTRIYLRFILLFAPAFMLNNVVLCFVRNDGNPNLSMAGMLTGSLANIVLDYVFIFPLGMGITGAVTATCLAPLISLTILSHHLRSKKSSLHPLKPALSAGAGLRLLSLGISSLITETASGIVIITFNFIILALQGNTGVAAYGIIANLSLVVTSIYTGIAQGIQPLLSSAHGAGNKEEINKVYKYALTSSLIFSAAVYALLVLFRHSLTAAFNSSGDTALAEMAVQGIVMYFTAFFFVGVNIISALLFGCTERPALSFTLSMLRGIVLILPFALLLSKVFGMPGVWLAFPAAEAVTCAAAVFLMLKYRKCRS